MKFGSCPSTQDILYGSQIANSGEEGIALSPCAFMPRLHSAVGVAGGLVEQFLHMAPQ